MGRLFGSSHFFCVCMCVNYRIRSGVLSILFASILIIYLSFCFLIVEQLTIVIANRIKRKYTISPVLYGSIFFKLKKIIEVVYGVFDLQDSVLDYFLFERKMTLH